MSGEAEADRSESDGGAATTTSTTATSTTTTCGVSNKPRKSARGRKRSYENVKLYMDYAQKCRNEARDLKRKARRLGKTAGGYSSGAVRGLLEQAQTLCDEANYWKSIARLKRTTVYVVPRKEGYVKFWCFRIVFEGKPYTVVLGSTDELTEQEARDLAVSIKAALLGVIPPYGLVDDDLRLKYDVEVVRLKEEVKRTEKKGEKKGEREAAPSTAKPVVGAESETESPWQPDLQQPGGKPPLIPFAGMSPWRPSRRGM